MMGKNPSQSPKVITNPASEAGAAQDKRGGAERGGAGAGASCRCLRSALGSALMGFRDADGFLGCT
ncbi:hypothetical protein PSCLAVI8L_190019 [Pseudoclavibacter sp. 8L]|nr:hypothetical protein PSCLAVI8L_190019 [Pseudoclavibacter sp. 8L]